MIDLPRKSTAGPSSARIGRISTTERRRREKRGTRSIGMFGIAPSAADPSDGAILKRSGDPEERKPGVRAAQSPSVGSACRRQCAGVMPMCCLNARWKAASD